MHAQLVNASAFKLPRFWGYYIQKWGSREPLAGEEAPKLPAEGKSWTQMLCCFSLAAMLQYLISWNAQITVWRTLWFFAILVGWGHVKLYMSAYTQDRLPGSCHLRPTAPCHPDVATKNRFKAQQVFHLHPLRNRVMHLYFEQHIYLMDP